MYVYVYIHTSCRTDASTAARREERALIADLHP